MRKIILLILIAFMYSCTNFYDCNHQNYYKYLVIDVQKKYVNYIIDQPSVIFFTISRRNYSKKFSTESSKNFVIKESLEQFINPLQTLKQEGYELEIIEPWMYRDSLTQKVHFCNEMIAKSKTSDLFITFYFKSERSQINLVNIEVNHYAYNDIKRGFALIDTIKQENQELLKWLIDNPNDFIVNVEELNNKNGECRSLINEDSMKIYQEIIYDFNKNGYSIELRETRCGETGNNHIIRGRSIGINDYIVVKSKQRELYLSFWFSACNDYQNFIRIKRNKKLYYDYYVPLDAHPKN